MFKASVIKNPNGTWSLVGSVRITDCYKQANDMPLTEEQINTIKHCGPGILGKQIKSITYKTKEDAEKCIAE